MMIEAENVKPYSDEDSKGRQVSSMFDNIAHSYDLMNAAMTMGLHHLWLRTAINLVRREWNGQGNPEILDVATGTGDVAFRLLERFPGSFVTGIDLSPGMLKVARHRAEGLHSEAHRRISFRVADCLALPFEEGTFDIVTVAYGVRNFEHLQEGLDEMSRVMRPGGVICIVELSEPTQAICRIPYRLYTRTVIPAVGRLVSHDPRAYSYLPQSIAACPQRNAMTALMEKAGFSGCRWRSLTFGAVTVYTGRKG